MWDHRPNGGVGMSASVTVATAGRIGMYYMASGYTTQLGAAMLLVSLAVCHPV